MEDFWPKKGNVYFHPKLGFVPATWIFIKRISSIYNFKQGFHSSKQYGFLVCTQNLEFTHLQKHVGLP